MKFIFVFAHPDDESFSSGGTIAKLVKSGHKVKLITATRGEKGQVGNPPICKKEELGKVREQELRCASKTLGISEIFFLDYIDADLINIPQEELSSKILEVLKKEKPDIVITFNEEGGSRHPDHIKISETATLAFKSYSKKVLKHVRLYYTAMPRSFIKKLKKQNLTYNIFGTIKGTPDELVTSIIDISKTLNIKIEAFKCHKTQHKDWERHLERLKNKETNYEYFRLVLENNLI